MDDYKVRFEVFEGPLDLLLYLVKKEEVDIYEINISKITQEFIDYIEVLRRFDLEVAGEFLVMAATLMLIKSRELLPVEQRVRAEDQDDGEDPRWELIRRLVEYKKFKDAAGRLQELEREQENIYPRVPGRIDLKVEPVIEEDGPTASIESLIRAVNQVMKRFHARAEDARSIFEDRWTISEKMEEMLEKLRTSAVLDFQRMFDDAGSRVEVVVMFLALLELTRLRKIDLVQNHPFGEIRVAAIQSEDCGEILANSDETPLISDL